MANDRAQRFLELHKPGEPLLLPNPWDVGSARLLASLGFSALATTSSGFAGTLGRLDGSVSLDEAIGHAEVIVAATELPVSADLENGYADSPDAVAATVRRAIDAGLAGCSVEDYSGDRIYDIGHAAERMAAAAQAAHAGPERLVLTGRAENLIRGRRDLADTVSRLQAYQEAGADVLYAPGLSTIADVRSVVSSVDRPVNVLAWPGGPEVAELADAGVARVSIGGLFAFAALGSLAEAAREFQGGHFTEFAARAAVGVKAVRAAFGAQPG